MKKVAVVRYSALGDLVTLEPSFRAIRHFFANYEIDFYTSQLGKELYEDSNYFDNFYLDASLSSLLDKKYRCIFDFQCTKPTFFMIFLMKKEKVVHKTSFFDKLLKRRDKVLSIEEMLIRSGIDEKKVEEYFEKEKNKEIRLPLDMNKVKKTTAQCVVIAPGASERWETKKWGKEKYSRLVEYLKDSYEIVVVGSSNEKEEAEYLSKHHPQIINLVGKTSLQELKCIIASAKFFIGNDSGPAHIAAGVGVPTITIFGPTSLKHCVKNFYTSAKHICITTKEKLACQPCYKTKCPYDMECMKSITPQDVFDAIKRLLDGEVNE